MTSTTSILMGLNIISSLSILFLTALGLFIIYGLMNTINLAHGEFIMLGAFTGFVITQMGLSPWLSFIVAPIVVGIISIFIEKILMRHIYGKVMESILATWGLSIILIQVIELIFGKGYKASVAPINTTISIIGVNYPMYRILIMVLALLLGVGLFLLERKTSLGVTVRAVINNPTLASSLGVNINKVYQLTFIFGAALAGFAGSIIAPLVSVYPGMGFNYVINGFLSVLVGGTGIFGLFGSSSLLGGSESLISFLFNPILGGVAVVMIAVLFMRLRPNN